jgi:hypothetical protein
MSLATLPRSEWVDDQELWDKADQDLDLLEDELKEIEI